MRTISVIQFFTLLPATLLLFIGTAGPLAAEAPPEKSPEAAALALEEVYSGMTSLSFDFRQVTRSGGRERTGRGNAVFYRFSRKPAPTARSVMRWNYEKPDRQVIINDGTTLMIYTEKDRQLLKIPAREIESDITYAFFAGTRKLLDDFEAQEPDTRFIFSDSTSLRSILLVPRKPHNQIRAVQVWFDEQNIIHHLAVMDHFDSVTELSFTNINLNGMKPDDPDVLRKITGFTVPPGTEIIDQ